MNCKNHFIIVAIIFFSFSFSQEIFASGFNFEKRTGSFIEIEGDTARTNHYSKERIYNFQLDYGNDRVSKGIKQTNMQPYLSPSFTYSALSGFNCGFSSTFLFKTKGFDEFDLNAGWDFKLYKELYAGASLSKFFYTTNSPQAKSSVSASINADLKHDFEIIDSKLNFDFDFFKGKKKITGVSSNDYSFSLDNSHTFNIDSLSKKGDELIISPGITITAGTQNIYQLYFQKLIKKSNDFALSAQDSSIGKFALTGIDFYLPVEYEIRKFYIEPSLHYLIPENQPSILNLKNYFYFEIAAGFDF